MVVLRNHKLFEILFFCNYSVCFNFGSGQGARSAEPERIWEYVRAHGAKSTKFVRANGCEHHSNVVMGQKGSDLSSDVG